jgi:hypothetical protein
MVKGVSVIMNETNDTRAKWIAQKTWSKGIFESLERFVDTESNEYIERFVDTGDQYELFGDGIAPEPRPSQEHVEYMIAYAKNEILN